MSKSKLLGQGGFGCIFYPGINTDGSSTSDKYATKLQKKTYTSHNELEIGEKIKSIKGYKNFFRVHISHSELHLSSIDDTLLKNCKPLKMKENISYIALKLEYIENPDFFEYLFDIKKSSKEQIRIILESYGSLLNGFSELLKKNVVQFDLKNENILYNKKKNRFLISDFGISIDMDNYDHSSLYKFFYVYAPEYYVWGFDVHILCLLLHNDSERITMKHIIDTAKRFINANPALSFFSNEFQNIYYEKCIEFGKDYIDRSGERVRDDKIKKLISGYTTWDNYALSGLYLRILSKFYNEKIPNSKLLIKYSQLLMQNLSPSPDERLTIDNTIKIYHSLLKMDTLEESDMKNMTQVNYDYKKVISESKRETELLKTISGN